MRVKSLVLKNFKGIVSFFLNATQGNVTIFGDNATGKTTLADAFMWLLFDKDSLNRKDFEIKTLGNDGKPEHGLEHSVEAVLSLSNGQELTLKKVFMEKWTKKRGSAIAEFSGHTTDYFIDGVPSKKKEYDEQIASIADESIFRLLTDPLYFNTQLHWQKRRELLLEICGDIADDEVIKNESNLSKLEEFLKGRNIEQHRKIVMAKRAEINKELQKIPVRIDEVKLGLPDISNIPDTLDKDIENAQAKIKNKQQELARVETGGEIAEQRKLLAEIDAELLQIKYAYQSVVADEIAEKRKEKDRIMAILYALQSERIEVNRAIDLRLDEISRLENKNKGNQEYWETVNNRIFETDDACPTCGQSLPKEQVEKTRADFNRKKAIELEDIKKIIDQDTHILEGLKEQIKTFEAQMEEKKLKEAEYKQQFDSLQNEVEDLTKNMPPVEDIPEYQAKLKERSEIEGTIQQLKQDTATAVAIILAEIKTFQELLEMLETEKSQLKQHEQGQARIKELKAEERRLAAEFESLEQQLFLTEEFIRTKVKLLENKINSKFRLARFKLFNVLINGGVEETCETTLNGVPYGNLNNGARLNVGLDIINILAEHYKFAPPVWIDNAESVTDILPTKGQQIKLVVSEKDKKLRIKEEC